MSKTTLLLLSVAISAFILGGTTLLFLDTRYVRVDGPQPKIKAGSSDFVRLDNGTQICWGELTVRPQSDGNNRAIDGRFRVPFADEPRVTLGIHPKFTGGPALTWEAYTPSITPTGYSGNIIGSGAAPAIMAAQEIRVDYVAVGKWK